MTKLFAMRICVGMCLSFGVYFLIYGFWMFASIAQVQNTMLVEPKAIDGDTFTLNGDTIRLWGIDAPEIGQGCYIATKGYDCGRYAKEALQSLIKGGVVCQSKNEDQYGRIVAICFKEKKDISMSMVGMGWALDYDQYSDGYYREAMLLAEKEKKGIWQSEFLSPHVFRLLEKYPLVDEK